jgi:hypothetical protein
MTPEDRCRQSAFKDCISDLAAAQVRLLDVNLPGAADLIAHARQELSRQYAEFLEPMANEVAVEMGLAI